MEQSPFGRGSVETRLMRTLARRALAELAREDGAGRNRAQAALGCLDAGERAAAAGDAWHLHAILEDNMAAVGADWMGAITALVVCDRLAGFPAELVGDVLGRVFAAGRPALLEAAWRQALRDAPQFVPDFWLYQAFCRSLSEAGHPDSGARVREVLAETEAGRLLPLVAIYHALLRQTDMPRAMREAAALEDPEHRRKMAVWALGASQTPQTMPLAVALHDAVAGPDDSADRGFMQARLAVAEGRWADALALTEPLVETGELRHAALCLRALALAQDGRRAEAGHALDHVRLGGHAPWFLVGRAQLIGLTARLLADGAPLPGTMPAPALATGPGRPLAQSLWVGPRLRWIERMSMQSYLANGWRYQLYVYEVPENLPDGVEPMDAAAILPRDALFREGAGSGMHRGSIGAFSDLFRYALLDQRGGMWTDTDVINLDRFEPEGARFVATEISDAGILGTNGAMMAAPPGCPVQRLALRRARALIEGGDLRFARIGPVLLAEILAEGGLAGYDLLPPEFLNPVGWMETGALLEPFDRFVARPVLARARNIHVYTETWRLIGLELGAPPAGDGFLARLSRMLEDPPAGGATVREMLAR